MRRIAFLLHTQWRLAIVSLTLFSSFALTGFISSAYRSDRAKIGQSHYELAQSEIAKGEMDEGIDEYRKALIFSPDKTSYRLSLATALVKAGRVEEAETHLQQLLEEDPTNGYLNLMLGRVALLRHKANEAVDYYQRAVYEYWLPDQIPERRKGRWELIDLLIATGKPTEAVGELMQLYANVPPDPPQRAKIGFLLLKHGALSEAATVFQRLTHDAPQFEAGYRGLGEVDLKMANYVSARHELGRAVRLNPKDKAAADEVALTNDIIDLNPAIPNIASQERYKRSKALLSRIVRDLTQCAGDSIQAPLQERIDEAQKMLDLKKPPNADASLTLQAAAQSLWKDRALFCGRTPPTDDVVDLVLAGIGQ